MFAPPLLPAAPPHYRPPSVATRYALSASEALTSLLSSLPPLPLAAGDCSLPLAGRCVGQSPHACKVEEVSDDDDDAVATPQRPGTGHGRQSSNNSSRSRPHSSGAFSQASQSTVSTSLSFASEQSPTPRHLPASNGPITLQLATALHPGVPEGPSDEAPPPQSSAAASLAVILDPHLVHLLCLYSNRSLSPFDEQSIWSCFLCHLQQPDPLHPGHLLPLCDKQYQRSSRRSFKNHVWRCLCRHFPNIAKFTYPEFRRLCATDGTVMAGFHAVTLFPRPQKKRRSTAELTDGERWLCPHGCGQEYRNTSSTSIGRHMRKECRLKDKSEEEKDQERRTLKQHEKDIAAYQALKAASDGVAETNVHSVAPPGTGTPAAEMDVAHNKRLRLSSTEPIARTTALPLMRVPSAPITSGTISAASTATTLPSVMQTFSAASAARDAGQLALVAATAVPSGEDGLAAHVAQQADASVAGGAGHAGTGAHVMSTAEIALLEAQLMETMHTQMVVDRLLADRLLIDMATRAAAAAAAANNSRGATDLQLLVTDSGGGAAAADGAHDWGRHAQGVVNNVNGEADISANHSSATAVIPFSPPRFVSMSNAPSPFASTRQLQRPTDSHRFPAMQAVAATLVSPTAAAPPPTTTHAVSHNLAPSTPSASTFTAHQPAQPPQPTTPYPLLTSEEAMAVLRQQLSLRCVSFLSQPGRDVRLLPSALMQLVAGLPLGVGSAMVQETLLALGLDGVMQRSGGHDGSVSGNVGSGSGNGNSTGRGSTSSASSSSSTVMTSVSAPQTTNFHFQPPSTNSTTFGPPSAYAAYTATSSAPAAAPRYQSTAASILLSPLSLMDSSRMFATPVEAGPAAVPSLPTSAHGATNGTAMAVSLPSPPRTQSRPRSTSLSLLSEWLNALPVSSAPLNRQPLLPFNSAAALPMSSADVSGPRKMDDMSRGGRPHSNSHPAAAVGQHKLLQLATAHSADPRLCQTSSV